jgi:mitochondrial chaperone BCS1
MLWDQIAAGGLMGTGLFLLVVNQGIGYVKSIPLSIYHAIKRRVLVTVEIQDKSFLLKYALPWVSEQRVLLGGVRTFQGDTRYNPVSKKYDPHLEPAPGSYLLWDGKRLVKYSRVRRMLESKAGSDQAYQDTYFFTFYFAGKHVAEEWLKKILSIQADKDPSVDVKYYQAGNWYTMAVSARPLGSVFLPATFESELLTDIKLFRSRKKWYAERGIPYRRGYMLHGEPGSGKSSLLRALCTEFDMTLVYVPLAGWVGSEQQLRGMLSNIPANSIVVMEDIDCLFSGREWRRSTLVEADDDESEDSSNAVYGRPKANAEKATPSAPRTMSFAGLLNALDGVMSTEGYILIMTTNHPEKLDPALIRPGRVDRHFYLGHAEPDQAVRYMRAFYEGRVEEAQLGRLSAIIGSGKYSMAELQEVFLEHAEDPVGALDKLASKAAKHVELKVAA